MNNTYKLPVGDIKGANRFLIDAYNSLALLVINSDEVPIESKKEVAIVLAIENLFGISTLTIIEMFKNCLNKYIPEGYGLDTRADDEENIKWGIWPIKPVNPVKPVITATWPDWAKYAAMDECTSWFWYEQKPSIFGNRWGSEFYRNLHESEEPKWSGYWKESLVERPSK